MKKIIMAENQEFFSDVKIGAHHFAELFAKNGYEVLWLSPAYSPMHYINDKEMTKKRQQLNKGKKVKLKENIYGYAPFTIIPFVDIPGFNSEFNADFHLKTAVPSLKSELKNIGFDNVDILWISNLKMLYVKEHVKYNKLVHRLSDEKSGFKGFFKTLGVLEEKLLKESDVVFATAKLLEDKARIYSDNVYYIPNGVNYSNFQKENYVMPEEFKKFNDKKRVIYIGAISEWLDCDMIEEALKDNMDVEFFFIGPDKGVLEPLKIYKNLHVLGKRSYESLPNYLNFSHCAIIPFKKNKLTDAINPVKLYEYLACGVPSVTSDYKEINYVKGPFFIAKDPKEFSSLIKKVIESKQNSEELKSFAKANDWTARIAEILEKV